MSDTVAGLVKKKGKAAAAEAPAATA